jgi:hypothetical protein
MNHPQKSLAKPVQAHSARQNQACRKLPTAMHIRHQHQEIYIGFEEIELLLHSAHFMLACKTKQADTKRTNQKRVLLTHLHWLK